MGKSISNKYGQKVLKNAEKPTTEAIKTASKTAIQKTAEATGDLTCNKVADKITSASKKSNKTEEDVEITAHKKKILISRRKVTNY